MNQWQPAIYENTVAIEPPHNDKNYHFDVDMADKAIAWVRMQHAVAPERPFLMYYATGTAHAPHHAPKDWIAKYKGQFDQGWDKVREETFARQKKMGVIPASAKLTPRPADIPAWDSLNADQKKVYARMMEVYSASLSHADYHVGRILDSIRDMGRLDNTLVIFIQGDNGASAEGTLQGTTNEMATALNGVTETTAYQLSMLDELGGPLAYNHYPVGWAHSMNTPFQWTKQVASHFGGTSHRSTSWEDPDDFSWELYHVADDFSQSENLAAKNPAKLAELKKVFDREARKYNVYPIDASAGERADPSIRPSLTKGRSEFTFYPGLIRIPEASAPDIKNKSFSITADVEIPKGGASGVLVTLGGRFAGWGLFLLDGKPLFVHAISNQEKDKFRIASKDAVPSGKHVVRFDFAYDGGGVGKGGKGSLTVDDRVVAEGTIPRTVPFRFSFDETFDVGEDTGTPLIEDYADKMPFRFSGVLEKLTVKLADTRLTKAEATTVDEGKAKADQLRD